MCVKCISDLQWVEQWDFWEVTEYLHKYIQYLQFQFTMTMLSRQYDVIFEENLQKLFIVFIYDVIQTLNRRIDIDILN